MLYHFNNIRDWPGIAPLTKEHIIIRQARDVPLDVRPGMSHWHFLLL